jgi:hypothetical protein
MNLFHENKYTKWYYSLINNRISNPHSKEIYTERHHIIPKSLGGDNSKKNFVRLSAREHFLAHWLLSKMCISKNHNIKMNLAISRLMGESDKSGAHLWSKWQYEKASESKRTALSIARSMGKDPRKGKKHSAESKEKMRLAKLGKKRPELTVAVRGKREHSKETKDKICKSLRGRPVSDKTKETLSKSMKGKPQNKTKMICKNCGEENYTTQIKRYHNDNCKNTR